jgi:hypothetical protein
MPSPHKANASNRFDGVYIRSEAMRLEGLVYKHEEELSDAELELRLRNIMEKWVKTSQIAHDPHASAAARRAACKLDSSDVLYYFDLLNQIGKAEKNKRKCSRELVTKKAALKSLEIGNDNLAGRSTEFGDRRTLQFEVDRLQQSIDSAIGEINGERAFIQEHENDINVWLTATGLSADDDLRPPGTFAKAAGGEVKPIESAVPACAPERAIESRPLRSNKNAGGYGGKEAPFDDEGPLLIYNAIIFLRARGRRDGDKAVMSCLEATCPDRTGVFGYWDDDKRHLLTEVLANDKVKRLDFQKKLYYVKCKMKKLGL